MVILDLNLPKRPGREVLRQIRQNLIFNNVPVLVLSSSDTAKDRREVAELGAERYVRKPSRFDEYLAIGGTIRELLSENIH
jgi:two-component system response regulator